MFQRIEELQVENQVRRDIQIQLEIASDNPPSASLSASTKPTVKSRHSKTLGTFLLYIYVCIHAYIYLYMYIYYMSIYVYIQCTINVMCMIYMCIYLYIRDMIQDNQWLEDEVAVRIHNIIQLGIMYIYVFIYVYICIYMRYIYMRYIYMW